MKQLPVYLLLDCSESMQDEIDTLTTSVHGMISELRVDKATSQQIWMSILTFNHEARRLHRLEPLGKVQPPKLEAVGGTYLGRALGLLNVCMDEEISDPGRWLQPQVVVMTDGRAEDDWRPQAYVLRQRVGRVIGMAVGVDADVEPLSYFSTHVARIDRRSSAKIAAIFQWMGGVIQNALTHDGGGDIPPPPDAVTVNRGEKPELDPNSPWRTFSTAMVEFEKLQRLAKRIAHETTCGSEPSMEQGPALQHIVDTNAAPLPKLSEDSDPETVLVNVAQEAESAFASWSPQGDRPTHYKMLEAMKLAVQAIGRLEFFACIRRGELEGLCNRIETAAEHISNPDQPFDLAEVQRLGLSVLSTIGRAEAVAKQTFFAEREFALILESLSKNPNEATARLQSLPKPYLGQPAVARKLYLHAIQEASRYLLTEKDGHAALGCLQVARSVPCPDSGLSTTLSILEMAARERVVDSETKDPVDCTVFSPRNISRGRTCLVQVLLHLPQQANEAAKAAKESDRNARRRGFKNLSIGIRQGDTIGIELLANGLTVENPCQELVWRGKLEGVQFRVTADPKARLGDVPARVTLLSQSVPIGKIEFVLTVARAIPFRRTPRSEPVGSEASHFKLAFASYASEDRERVLARVQLLPLLGIRFFLDVLSLDPGARWEREIYKHIDECDVFLLFWSEFSKRSQWVRKETQRAIARKSGKEEQPPEIRPVILDGPPVVEPWKELEAIHFNDRMDFFTQKQRGTTERASS